MSTSSKVLSYRGNIELISRSMLSISKNGFLGGDHFAVSSSSQYNSDYPPFASFLYSEGAYPCLSKNVHPSSSDPFYYTMYFPLGAKLTSISIKNRSKYPNAFKDIELQSSQDGSSYKKLVSYVNSNNTASGTWSISIPSNSQDYYKYYRFKVISGHNSSEYVSVGFLTPVGQWKSPIIKTLKLFTSPNDSEVVGRCAPIKIDGQTLYVPIGVASDPTATPIRCKPKGIDLEKTGELRLLSL